MGVGKKKPSFVWLNTGGQPEQLKNPHQPLELWSLPSGIEPDTEGQDPGGAAGAAKIVPASAISSPCRTSIGRTVQAFSR